MAAFDPIAPEVWYPVPEFDAYRISSRLRLMSFHQGNRRAATTGRIIKIHADDRGYRKLILWRDGRYHTVYLHHVVAELSIGPRPPGMNVLHGDDDKSNNWPENLRYGTQSDNVTDCKSNGHFVTLRGEQRSNTKLCGVGVRAIRSLYGMGVSRGALADAFDVQAGVVRNVTVGARWGHADGEVVPVQHPEAVSRSARLFPAVVEILTGVGRPMRVVQVVAAMRDAGCDLPDRAEPAYAMVRAILADHPEAFRQRENGAWCLVT